MELSRIIMSSGHVLFVLLRGRFVDIRMHSMMKNTITNNLYDSVVSGPVV